MALIKCLGCGANISDKAIVCPKCGRKNLVDNKSDKNSSQEKLISNSEVKSFNLKYFVGAKIKTCFHCLFPKREVPTLTIVLPSSIAIV